MGHDARVKAGRPRTRGRPAGVFSRRARRRLTGGLLAVALLGASGAGVWWWTSRSGEAAPGVTLPASTGDTVRLEDFRGKQPVVLVFYMVGT